MFERIMRECRERFSGFAREAAPGRSREPRSFREAIAEAERRGVNPVIAEVKFSSPRGRIRELEDVAGIVRAMHRGGACGVSVLTEQRYFSGSLEYLRQASEASPLPVLRKDFLFHPEQVDEAYAYGADGVLLIASLLAEEELSALMRRCSELGVEALVEVHSEQDVELAESLGAEVVVINNRDKDTLEIDLSRSERLAPLVSGTAIAASGVESPEHVRRLLECCDAVLVGTCIMRSEDVEQATRRLVHA
ncbi:MAG: indole-3-glycerol-phosphate synthase [Euryarchaeota archaeon]|nr:indole-3-glycerol-phosphate synthase [Euryarchaeota archaeon]